MQYFRGDVLRDTNKPGTEGLAYLKERLWSVKRYHHYWLTSKRRNVRDIGLLSLVDEPPTEETDIYYYTKLLHEQVDKLLTKDNDVYYISQRLREIQTRMQSREKLNDIKMSAASGMQ